ncbi:MAG: hypothetical protein J07HQW2_03768 [Haloquadratum walsbyi J07HQW2]|uniref:Uncharacterized protein n=1 Tax=Haloquadratum walsbyi J07HQW2 TaxID=1238425 RepID=U1PTZ6_9EURY|nr:MAG: hypothetical protein J07HQW2_03768 [Haloquadratum walsbyi J07HQW2]
MTGRGRLGQVRSADGAGTSDIYVRLLRSRAEHGATSQSSQRKGVRAVLSAPAVPASTLPGDTLEPSERVGRLDEVDLLRDSESDSPPSSPDSEADGCATKAKTSCPSSASSTSMT